MEIAEKIGRTAFEFNLIFSLVVTIIGVSLVANGVNPGDYMYSMFIPIDWLYDSVEKIKTGMPSDYHPIELVISLGATGIVSIILEFMFMMLTGFLLLVANIARIIPAQLAFLKLPLFFLGAFIQLMVWIYAVNLMFDRLSSIIPFSRR